MRKTKLAMLQSVVALILCAAMLVGTTFAWFTDEVASAVNKIQAGTLDVDLVDAAGNSLEGTSLTFMDVTGNTDILWEPGCTFKTQGFRVANRGSLALEYTMYINGLLGDSKLLEVIRFSVQDADGYTVDIDTFEGQLSARASSDVFYLVGHMDENAGNEYMNLTLTGIGITVYATQAMEENDSFGPEYDKDAFFPGLDAPILGSVNITTENDLLTADAYIDVEGAKVTIPAGTRVEPGTTTLKLRVKLMDETTSDVKLSDNQVLQPMDVTVEGVSDDNQVPLTVELYEIAPVGLNMGSIALHHVHKGVTAPMTRVAADAAFTADNQYRYDPATGDLALHMATFSEVAVVADTENAWEGNFDYNWYKADATELTIANADQLAAFGAIVGGMAKDEKGKFLITYTDSDGDEHHNDSFSGKTVKLIADINLGDKESENNPDIIFYPIGYWNSEGTYEKTGTAISSGFYAFQGTFDGNGHTVSNFYQNTWEMKGDHNWYDPIKEQYYRDGMGLFGRVYKGTVKNLTIKNFSSDGEITTTGCVAAYADGATFENIAIFNCNPRVYNIGNGGIVGCVGWYAKEIGLKTTFKNITVDNSNKISALWGSYDVACGGIVGQYYPTSGQSSKNYPVNAGIHFENCHVSAVMDVYNDVCANYQYYAYRYTGMLIGSVRENETIDGHVYPKMDKITASGCTVHFGDWNDYYYCELVANSLASYTHDHQMSRLEQVASVDVANKTVTDLAGKTMAIPTSGRVNYVVVKAKDANGMWIHGDGHDYAECYHFVNGVQHFHDVADADNPNPTETVNGVAGVLKEDKQLIYREFNQLFTGYGWGVTSKGLTDFVGVENMDITQGDHENSVVKFEGKVTELANNKKYKLGDIFTFVDKGVKLVPGALAVSVHNLDKNNPVSATVVYDRENWENGTITLTGTGKVQITIQDYYFCTPTTIEVTIKDRQPVEKFVTKFTGDFLYRVGNASGSTVALGTLFNGTNVTNGNVTIAFETVAGNASGTYTANNTTWESGKIQFSGTGVVKVTITDNDYCIPTELLLEVVDAVNATTATSAKANNVVLLNDCGFSSLEVSGGYALYGNGFTMTCASDSASLSFGQFVMLNNGTLDNVQIVCPNYDCAALYNSQLKDTENNRHETTNGTTRYYNAKSAVLATGNSQILNSRISGGRAALYASSGNIVVDNSRLEGGAVATVVISAANSFVFRDSTLVQKPTASTYDSNKTLMGMSVLFLCDTDGNATPTTLEGSFAQYAWADSGCTAYMPQGTSAIATKVLGKNDYTHTINGKTCVNLGFAYMPNEGTKVNKPSNITDNRNNQAKAPYDYESVTASVPTDLGVSANVSTFVYSYKNTSGTDEAFKTVNAYVPNKYSDIIAVTYSDTAEGLTFDKSYGTDGWNYILKVDLDKLSSYQLDFHKLSMTVNGVATTDFTVNNSAKPTSPIKVTAGTTDYLLTTTLNGTKYAATLSVTGVETSKSAPQLIDASGNPIKADNVGWGTGKCVTRKANDGKTNYTGAAPVLDGVIVRYWSVKQGRYVDLKLSDLTPAKSTALNGTNNYWEYAVDGEYTLKITNTAYVHDGNKVYAMPVSTGTTMYFVASASNGLVSTGSGARKIAIKYEFADNNGGTLTFDHTWEVGYSSSGTLSYKDLTGIADGCFTPDTLITLADGTQKRVDELAFGDKILAWDFFTGTYVEKDIALLVNHGESLYRIANLAFSDGTALRIIAEHGVFDYDLNKFVYITVENMHEYVGHRFVQYAQDGSYSIVTLTDAYETEEYTSAWSITSAGTSNAFASGLLTVAPPEDFYNWIEMDGKLHYDAEQFQKDVQTYGLYTYEDFKDYVTYEQFVDWNGAYLKIAVEKGYFTFDYILELIELYKGWMPNN